MRIFIEGHSHGPCLYESLDRNLSEPVKIRSSLLEMIMGRISRCKGILWHEATKLETMTIFEASETEILPCKVPKKFHPSGLEASSAISWKRAEVQRIVQ